MPNEPTQRRLSSLAGVEIWARIQPTSPNIGSQTWSCVQHIHRFAIDSLLAAEVFCRPPGALAEASCATRLQRLEDAGGGLAVKSLAHASSGRILVPSRTQTRAAPNHLLVVHSGLADHAASCFLFSSYDSTILLSCKLPSSLSPVAAAFLILQFLCYSHGSLGRCFV
jgi:hypothetical protein